MIGMAGQSLAHYLTKRERERQMFFAYLTLLALTTMALCKGAVCAKRIVWGYA